MNDLIARLRNPAWINAHEEVSMLLQPDVTQRDMAAAAEEIERISALWIAETRENERLRAERAWQPIETAPKDGTEIVGWDGVSREVVAEVAGQWIVALTDLEFLPTHWQPLPTPPVNRPGESASESNA